MNSQSPIGLLQRMDQLEEELRHANETIAALRGDATHPALEPLTAKEREFAAVLLRASPRTLPRSAIMAALYDGRDDPMDSIVKIWVRKVRRKLPDLKIETVWGTGYRIPEVPEKYR